LAFLFCGCLWNDEKHDMTQETLKEQYETVSINSILSLSLSTYMYINSILVCTKYSD